MLRRYFGLLKKDIITGFRNHFFLAVIAVALIFVGIINFVIPENAEIKPMVYYYFEYDGEYEAILDEVIKESEAKHSNIHRANTKEEMIQGMKRNFNSLGMIIKEINNRPSVEFVIQGYENKEVINTLILSMKDDIDKRVREDMDIDTVFLKNQVEHGKIPLNKNVLPIFLTMEPSLLGLVLIAAFIFMEKDEGTIRAYRVSPGKIPEYLASKMTLMIILGWISTILSTFLVVGLSADYLSLFIIVTAASIFASALGLIIASFFENISQSIIWIIFISIIFSLPFISYFIPSFAPLYIKILPTYSLQFALREAVFPTGNMDLIYSTAITFIMLSIISYVIAIFAYTRNLTRN
ncbi:MAG: ABC transporter permease [Maledivibacter sp.]|jgi:hypothetical protein|nr:ABC transporter permease [Maledivibacter sp.]